MSDAGREGARGSGVAAPDSPTADKDRLTRRTRRFGALHQAERTLRSMRAYAGVIVTSSVAEPLMYILAMGLGLGLLVGDAPAVAELGAASYLMYIGPGVLAATVAMTAGIEFAFPVLEGFTWRRLYYGAQATPLTPGQIASGHILAVCVRFLFHSAVFTGVLVLVGATSSPLVWLQILTATLGGLALGVPIMAYISTLREEKGHGALIQRFVIMPLFLFSGTFYPLENLPGPLQAIGWISPIWHANELGRVLSFGQPTSPAMIAAHLGYLVVVTLLAWWATVHVFTRRLGLAEWRGRTPGARADARREARVAELRDDDGPAGPAPVAQFRTGAGAGWYSGNIRAVFARGLSAIRNNRGVLFVSGFLEPILFLTSFGLGISPMISGIEAEQAGVGQDGTISYAAFIAPALLAVSAMNGAIFDSTWNVFFKLKITKLFRTMMATSLGPVDVALGEIGLALFRGAIYSVGFLAVLVGAGLVDGVSAVLMWVTALFIALGFAAVGMAVTSFFTRFQQMDWMMMVLMPMFLFSATLFPIDVYPAGVQALVQAMPLWHGVELMRDIAFRTGDAMTLVHIGYYLVMVVVGLGVATWRMRRLFQR